MRLLGEVISSPFLMFQRILNNPVFHIPKRISLKDAEISNEETLSHVRWNCKYHLVFISTYRHRMIYSEVRKKVTVHGLKFEIGER